jgi:ferritin-like metal-binding protein YciE
MPELAGMRINCSTNLIAFPANIRRLCEREAPEISALDRVVPILLMRDRLSSNSRNWPSSPRVQILNNQTEGTRAMGLFTKDIETMDDLLLHGLKDIYYAENQIIKSLPKLIEKATNRELTKGLRDHLEETKDQVARLDQVFKKLGQEPQGVKCPAIDGLISEADEIAGEVVDKDVLDAAIVGAAQSVEHYEIARYGTLIAWAESLGYDDIIRLLNTNLNEEKAADKKLSTVALRKGVNRKAAS